MGKKTTRFQIFLLVLDEWMTIKFEHCIGKLMWSKLKIMGDVLVASKHSHIL